MADSCVLYPEVNGEDSLMYKDLLKLVKDRALANFIYASYLQEGVVSEMKRQVSEEGKKWKLNKQGEFRAKDVVEFFDVSKLELEASKIDLIARQVEAKDDNNKSIDYVNAKEALNKAISINSNYPSITATVVQKGNVFNIVLEPRNARTIGRVHSTSEMQSLWQTVEQAFNKVGIDINSLSSDPLLGNLVNATKAMSLIEYLNNIKDTRPGILTVRDIKLLLSLNPDSQRVKRLVQDKYGDLDTAAQKIYGYFKGTETLSSAEQRLVLFTLDECKKFNGVDVKELLGNLQTQSNQLKDTSAEYSIKKTLDELDEKYHINKNEILVTGRQIKSLSHAAAEALIILNRQLRKLENEIGVTAETKELESKLRLIQKNIDNKKYLSGCLHFLNDTLSRMQDIDTLFSSLYNKTGTDWEIHKEKAKVSTQVTSILDAYAPFIDALSDTSFMILDEDINEDDKQLLEQTAKRIKEILDKQKRKLEDFNRDTFTDIATSILGNTLADGTSIVNILEMADADSSIFDYLRSVGDTSNSLINSMGSIIRNAQDTRNAKITAIEKRIAQANKKLFDSGSKSDFMYDSDGYIISDLDWKSYNKAKEAKKKELKKQGLRGLDLKEALDNWEIENTEERLVDNTNGRTERVPGPNYRKEFPPLTDAQLEYYKEMMQIKGEIGSLLPAYAQKQYLPPQLRRSFLDAIANAKSAKDVVKAISNKIKDLWTIREDDTDYAKMGVIEGEEYGITIGGLDNTPLRQIPIFYVRKIKDQSELLKDFSGALQALAGTAINYDAMYQIKDVVEFMADYIKDQQLSAIGGENKKLAEVVESRSTLIGKQLFNRGKATNTIAILEGFIDQHIYGEKMKDTGKYSKILQSLIKYTSIKNLTTNVAGAIANLSIAELQMIYEAVGGEFYGVKDYLYAQGRLFGDFSKRMPGKLQDFLDNDKTSEDVLLADLFDPIPGRFQDQSHKRYYKSQIRKGIESINPLVLYGGGEYLVHYAGMYSILHKEKVKLGDEEISLIDAFEKTTDENGNTVLKIKDGVTKDGNPLTIEDEYISKIRRRIREANESTQGAMSEEAKGIIHQRLLGKAVMQFRQWMVKTYDKRFRKEYWNANLGEYREGSSRSFNKWVKGLAGKWLKTEFENAILWEDMTDHQKANVKKSAAEKAMLVSLMMLSFVIKNTGLEDEYEDNYWFRLWLYNHKRMQQDVMATATILGAGLHAKGLINQNIIPSLATFNGLFVYPIVGLINWDFNKKIESGRHAGENKYVHNILKYSMPFYKQIDQLIGITEENTMFGQFDSANKYR